MSELIIAGATLAVASTLVAKMAKPVLSKKLRKYTLEKSLSGFEDFLHNVVEASPEEGSEYSKYMQENFNELMHIIRENEQTEYGQEYHFEDIKSYDDFKEKIPLQFYSDISEKIDRMCEDGKNLLSADKTLFFFATSSGTTGKRKMIPVSSSFLVGVKKLMISGGAALHYLIQQHGEEKVMSNLCPYGLPTYSPVDIPRTNGGTPYGPLSQSSNSLPWYYLMVHRAIYGMLTIVPHSLTNKVLHFETNLLLQVFLQIMTEDIVSLNITFGATFMHYLLLLESHFSELIECIESGSINPCEVFCQNIPKDLQNEINDYIYQNYSIARRKKRAEELRKITSFENVIEKIWPSVLYISCSVSGAFSIYEDSIKRYVGNVPLLGAVYMCSEGPLGFQFNENGEYIFHPNVCFYEFIHEDDIKSENPKTLLLHQLQVGNRYELIITTQTGFYRYRMGDVIEVVNMANDTVPLFKICYRTGSILDAFGEKTTEVHVEEALKRYANENSLKLVDFTTFLAIERSPVVYQIFVEFANEDGSPVEVMLEGASNGIDNQLREVHNFYDKCRDQSKLGEIECKFMKPSTFIELKEKLIESGTAPLQCKIPRLIKSIFLPFLDNQTI